MVAVDVVEAWQLGVTKPIMKAANYPEPYHRHLQHLQGGEVTILEIGVHWGGSLQLWRTYFGDRATIVGVDIVDECTRHEAEGVHVRIGDQSDPAFLASLIDEFGPFDAVLDDGSHQVAHQVASFEALFPAVRDGGVYSCEDTGSNYLADFGGARGKPGTFIEAVKSLVDDLHLPAGSAHGGSVKAVHFYNGVLFVEKGLQAPPAFMGSGEGGGEIQYIPVRLEGTSEFKPA
jgi:hypothetical protein